MSLVLPPEFQPLPGSLRQFTIDATVGGVPLPSIPAAAQLAVVSFDMNSARYSDDTTSPAVNVGILIPPSEPFSIVGRKALLAARFFQGGYSTTANVTYYG